MQEVNKRVVSGTLAITAFQTSGPRSMITPTGGKMSSDLFGRARRLSSSARALNSSPKHDTPGRRNAVAEILLRLYTISVERGKHIPVSRRSQRDFRAVRSSGQVFEERRWRPACPMRRAERRRRAEAPPSSKMTTRNRMVQWGFFCSRGNGGRRPFVGRV